MQGIENLDAKAQLSIKTSVERFSLKSPPRIGPNLEEALHKVTEVLCSDFSKPKQITKERFEHKLIPLGIADSGEFEGMGVLTGVILPILTPDNHTQISFGLGIYPCETGIFICSVYSMDIEEEDGEIVREKTFHSGYIVSDPTKIKSTGFMAIERMYNDLAGVYD